MKSRYAHAHNTWIEANFPGTVRKSIEEDRIDGLKIETHTFESRVDDLLYSIRAHIVFPEGLPEYADPDGIHQALVGKYSLRLLEQLSGSKIKRDESRAQDGEAIRRLLVHYRGGLNMLMGEVSASEGVVVERIVTGPQNDENKLKAIQFLAGDPTQPDQSIEYATPI